jgi:ABC-type glutathione transport system ATPase component
VLDEPFAGLDHDGRAQLIDVLSALRSTYGITIVVISHEEAVLSGVAERLIRLEAGRIVEDRGPSGSIEPEPAEQ